MAPHTPQRSERRGKPVALLDSPRTVQIAWEAPKWPPTPPNARSAAGNPWRSSMSRLALQVDRLHRLVAVRRVHHRVDGERAPVGRQRPGRLTRERLRLTAVLARHRRRGRGHEAIATERGLRDGGRAAMALLRPLRAVGDERLAVRALSIVARRRARHLDVDAVLLDEK